MYDFTYIFILYIYMNIYIYLHIYVIMCQHNLQNLKQRLLALPLCENHPQSRLATSHPAAISWMLPFLSRASCYPSFYLAPLLSHFFAPFHSSISVNLMLTQEEDLSASKPSSIRGIPLSKQ